MTTGKRSNIIITNNMIKYNALSIYSDINHVTGKEEKFIKLPDYLINEMMINEKKLLITHNGKTLVLKTYKETLDSFGDIYNKVYEGTFKKVPITYNLIQIKI